MINFRICRLSITAALLLSAARLPIVASAHLITRLVVDGASLTEAPYKIDPTFAQIA